MREIPDTKTALNSQQMLVFSLPTLSSPDHINTKLKSYVHPRYIIPATQHQDVASTLFDTLLIVSYCQLQ